MKRFRSGVRKIVGIALMFGAAIGTNVWGQQSGDANRPHGLAVLINRRGFEQQSMTIPAGNYLISIINRSGLSGVNLALERMQGNDISGVVASQLFADFPQEHGERLSKLVQLPVGTYRLRVADRPGWVVTIEVK